VSSILDVVVFFLSMACGVLGGFLLLHKGVRLLKGGLIHKLSVGLAVIGIVLTLASLFTLYPVEILPGIGLAQIFQLGVLVVLYYLAYNAWSNASKIEEAM